MMDLACSFLVVTSGNPWVRSNRIWWPNTESVPVPVRSCFSTPRLRTSSIRSRYCRIASQEPVSELDGGCADRFWPIRQEPIEIRTGEYRSEEHTSELQS